MHYLISSANISPHCFIPFPHRIRKASQRSLYLKEFFFSSVSFCKTTSQVHAQYSTIMYRFNESIRVWLKMSFIIKLQGTTISHLVPRALEDYKLSLPHSFDLMPLTCTGSRSAVEQPCLVICTARARCTM